MKYHLYSEKEFPQIEEALENFVDCDADVAAELVFASAEEIRETNRVQRGIDAVTDVLSFPTLDGIRGKKLRKKKFPYEIDEEGNLFLGSIMLCEERAREQAEEYGHSYERELHYLIVHGVMHLFGYDHMTDEDKAQMREKEEEILTRMGITR
ncbi:MAG: rRNA maturation RNase YbeY [Clostridia bacterium]|nr:rRNA maturation RNase YbeY [Clostridia bacterium]